LNIGEHQDTLQHNKPREPKAGPQGAEGGAGGGREREYGKEGQTLTGHNKKKRKLRGGKKTHGKA